METFIPTISIPIIPYYCNVVVFPNPGGQIDSPVFVLKKTAAVPEVLSQNILLEYAESHVYCLLPSKQMYQGTISFRESRPHFLQDFSYCLEIDRKAMYICKSPAQEESQVPLPHKRSKKMSPKSCKGCFRSHFPRPNTKLCKFSKISNPSTQTPNKWPVRLRG